MFVEYGFERGTDFGSRPTKPQPRWSKSTFDLCEPRDDSEKWPDLERAEWLEQPQDHTLSFLTKNRAVEVALRLNTKILIRRPPRDPCSDRSTHNPVRNGNRPVGYSAQTIAQHA